MPSSSNLSPRDASTVLAGTGWTAHEVLNGFDLADRYFARIDVPIARVYPKAFVAAASRT